MINGIVNICKESGFTSFDVIAKLRGILHQKKIGHTGTLDPEATGVLPVCLGNATKVCELIMDHKKTYEAVFAIGFSTDTQDSSGKIEEMVSELPRLSDEEIDKAVLGFKGEYEQLPPMYSAKKVDGKHLYDLARKGISVERKRSQVCIFDIDVIKKYKAGTDISDIAENDEHIIGTEIWEKADFSNVPFVRIRVCCSKGTYIRTLCYDIGQKLGVPAAMVVLRRLQVGPFGIDRAYTLAELEQCIRNDEKPEKYILSVDELFADYPAIKIKAAGLKPLLNGNFVFQNMIEEHEELNDGCYCRMYDCDGSFRAVYSYDKQNGGYKSVKMFL